MSSIIALGDNVSAYCKNCKKVIEHVVREMKGTKPKRVQCHTCDDTHPFRADKPTPRKRGASVAKAKGSSPVDMSYASLTENRDLSHAKSYLMTLPFAVSDLINHSKFGIGLVTRVLVDRKIEVLFPDDTRMLVHDR